MQTPLFLKPVLQERIWGGKELTAFGYKLPSQSIGECWGISAHPNGQSIIRNGKYRGKTLEEIWRRKPELFGNYKSDKFPLLTKILDANQDLSVQVHPNDAYANEYEDGEFGKTECWYIIDCKEGAEMIYGHHAKTKEEFIEMVNMGKWGELLRRVAIKPGDFFYVPSGTIHALCEGTLVLETQQNSDTTYRVYDYDRVDINGKKRDLHLDKAIEVSTVPHKDIELKFEQENLNGAMITKFVEDTYFVVYKWDIEQEASFYQDKCFQLVSIIHGEGTLITEDGAVSIQKGDHFILPNGMGHFTIKGEVTCIVSYPQLSSVRQQENDQHEAVV